MGINLIVTSKVSELFDDEWLAPSKVSELFYDEWLGALQVYKKIEANTFLHLNIETKVLEVYLHGNKILEVTQTGLVRIVVPRAFAATALTCRRINWFLANGVAARRKGELNLTTLSQPFLLTPDSKVVAKPFFYLVDVPYDASIKTVYSPKEKAVEPQMRFNIEDPEDYKVLANIFNVLYEYFKLDSTEPLASFIIKEGGLELVYHKPKCFNISKLRRVAPDLMIKVKGLEKYNGAVVTLSVSYEFDVH
jgi:hypothetical protein